MTRSIVAEAKVAEPIVRGSDAVELLLLDAVNESVPVVSKRAELDEQRQVVDSNMPT